MTLLLFIYYMVTLDVITLCFTTNMRQNISFDLSLMYDEYETCSHYFGNTYDATNALQAMNTIFYSTWQLYSNIISPPQTILSNGNKSINCSKSQNMISSKSHFIAEINNRTDVFSFNQFSFESAILLKQYFNDSIDILVYTKNVQIKLYNTSYPQMTTSIQMTTLLLCILIITIILCTVFAYLIIQYNNAFIVDKGLVLIIGISQFDEKIIFLPGVHKNVNDLKHLWKNMYHYDVFTCNNSSLYSTKTDIINFMDEHTHKLKENLYKAVIVHVISHGTQDEFITSDMKNIALEFINHEIKEACDYSEKSGTIKIIFYHCGRGNNNYSHGNLVKTNDIDLQIIDNNRYCCCSCNLRIFPDKSLDVDSQKISVDSNSVVIYGNVKDRVMSDSGLFTDCICASFGKNVQRIFKRDFTSLIKDIGNKLENITNSAEIVDTSGFGTLRHNQIIFKCASKKYTEYKEDDTLIEHTVQKPTTNMYNVPLVQEIISNENDYRKYIKTSDR